MHNISAWKDSASVVIPPFKTKWVKSSTTPLPPPHHDSPGSTNNKKKSQKGAKRLPQTFLHNATQLMILLNCSEIAQGNILAKKKKKVPVLESRAIVQETGILVQK